MATASNLKFLLVNFPDETLFTADVASTPSDPYIEIAYSSGVTGSFGNPLPGMTVLFGDASNPRSIGDARLRTFSGGASGTIKINESDDVGPQITAGTKIRVISQIRLWPKYPRFLQSGQNVTIFEDYDIAFSNQTNQWRPKAVAGPPAYAELSGGVATVRFVGDRSQAMAPGASITNYLWTARGSNEATSTSQGTEASPVVFTWSSPGRYLVTLQVTDSNGNTDLQHTLVVVENPANRSVTFDDFDTPADNFDFLQGGGECSFVVRGDASVSQFPQESMAMLVATGDITTPTGSWPFRTNVLFSGWIMTNSVRQNPDTGDVSFRAATIDAIMKNLTMFPVSLTFKNSPVDWTQARQLTVDRAAYFLYTYRSTLGLMTPIVFSGYDELIQRQDFGPGDLYNQVQNELMRSIYGAGKVISTHQGVIYHQIDHNIRTAAERAAATTRKTLHKGIWTNDVFIEERQDYSIPINAVKMSGVHYPGGDVTDVCPLFSEAPGDAPKVYGKETSFDRLIVESQAILNVRCGLTLAKVTERHPVYRAQFVNDGSFTVAPQELFPANIEATDNDRQLTYTGNLIPRRMSRQYNHQGGYFITSVDFEPVTTGPAGITVDMPCGPPEQELAPSQQPAPPSSIPGQTALILSTTGTSYYYMPGLEQTWERRVSGLESDQLGFLDLMPDPWSIFKQGYNPESYIVWGSGRGFLVRSSDTGKNWKDRSDYLEAPNWPGESGNTLANTDFMRLSGDIFAEDKLFVLARWQYTGAYHGAFAVSDDGFEYTNYLITGSSQVKPLWMSLDRGNGQSLWVTTWESEATGLYLRRYNAGSFAHEASYFLGGATLSEVEAGTWWAAPFNRNMQADEVFVYGRMNEPQGFTGSVHAMRNTARGATGSYSVIENSWASDRAAAFGADADLNYYAVRQGVGVGDGTITVNEIVNAGSMEGSQGVHAIGASGLADRKAVVIYDNGDISPNFNRSGRVIQLGASPGSMTINTEQECSTASDKGPVGVHLPAWTDDRVLSLFRAAAITISAQAITVSNGLQQQGNDATHKTFTVKAGNVANAAVIDVATMGTTRALAISATEQTGGGGYNAQFLTLLQLSGSTTFATLDEETVGSSREDKAQIIQIDNQHAVVLNRGSADGNAEVYGVSISGDSISIGSAVALAAADITYYPKIQKSGTDRFVVFEQYSTPGTYVLKLFSFTSPNTVTLLDTLTLTDSQIIPLDTISATRAIGVAFNPTTGRGMAAVVDSGIIGANIVNNLYAFEINTTGDVLSAGNAEYIEQFTDANDGLILDTVGSLALDWIEDARFLVAAWYSDELGDAFVRLYDVSFDTAGIARFYQGAGSLSEKFTLPFSGVRPAAFTLDKSLGTVVIGSDSAAAVPVIYSQYPYATGTATAAGLPTGISNTAIKWI